MVKLPGLGTLGTVWSIISFILFLAVVLPPVYGIIMFFTSYKTVPPFVPQDTLSKLGYGFVYGYYSVYSRGKRFLGFSSPVSIAKDRILSGSIIDVSENASSYPQYANFSLYIDSLLGNITEQQLLEYYVAYNYAMGINDTSSWSIDFFIVSEDAEYLLNDYYITYNGESFNCSLSEGFTVEPHYGIIVTKDIAQSFIDVFSGSNVDYAMLSLLIISSLRSEKVLMWQY